MPYNYAHALLALHAADRSDGRAAAVIARAPAAFAAGAMGPDPYFADAMPPPLFARCEAALGGRMHGLDARTLLFSFFSLAETDAQRAYALGFACHFLLDTNAHPYIFARFPGKAHTPGEMHLDLLFADTLADPRVSKRPCDFFRLAPDALDEIDALHANAASSLFAAASRGAFARAYQKWVYFVNRFSYDPSGKTLRAVNRFERLAGKPKTLSGWLVTRDPSDAELDLMNTAHATWAAPWDAAHARTESFPDLFNAALREAPALLDAAAAGYESGDFGEALLRAGKRCMNGSPVL